MRRNALVVGALSLVLAATTAMAQQPSFAGSWTLVPDPNATGGRGGGEVKLVYNLDGSDSKNMVMGRGGQTEQVSKASWDGAKLVISTTLAMGENTVTRTQTLALDESGQLVVTTTGPGRGGEQMTNTQTYKKG